MDFFYFQVRTLFAKLKCLTSSEQTDTYLIHIISFYVESNATPAIIIPIPKQFQIICCIPVLTIHIVRTLQILNRTQNCYFNASFVSFCVEIIWGARMTWILLVVTPSFTRLFFYVNQWLITTLSDYLLCKLLCLMSSIAG